MSDELPLTTQDFIMTWNEISKEADGTMYRRPSWPPKRFIIFSPAYVLIHWETKVNGYDVTFYNPNNENMRAEDWEPCTDQK